ncbi:hypothetical protein GQR58_019104 [Nymphon striatum]|nr:hypothetical protein GQR58_019104 [Nymphon striatum]
MALNKLSIDSLDLENKRVLMRKMDELPVVEKVTNGMIHQQFSLPNAKPESILEWLKQVYSKNSWQWPVVVKDASVVSKLTVTKGWKNSKKTAEHRRLFMAKEFTLPLPKPITTPTSNKRKSPMDTRTSVKRRKLIAENYFKSSKMSKSRYLPKYVDFVYRRKNKLIKELRQENKSLAAMLEKAELENSPLKTKIKALSAQKRSLKSYYKRRQPGKMNSLGTQTKKLCESSVILDLENEITLLKDELDSEREKN